MRKTLPWEHRIFWKYNLTNSYNADDITGGARVSGITGEIKTYTSIENCYNTGSVTTTATRTIYSGGLVGYGYGTTNNVSTVKNSYTNRCGYGKNSKWCSYRIY